jgi:shikimate dehydrogenase/3-dehydroquinate dehydratase type I
MVRLVASLVERSVSGVSRSSRKAFSLGADLVEVRLDHLEPAALTGRSLSLIRDAVHGPAIATLRSKAEGGLSALRGTRREAALRATADAGFESIDLEARTDAEVILAGIGSGPEVIVSSHLRAPGGPKEVERLLRGACSAGDIGKVAMPCADASQALMLARLGRRIAEERKAFALIGMGEQGALTRACAEEIGSAIVYCCLPGRPAAPGQFDIATQAGLRSRGRVLLGLLGHPVSHSVSKPMQEAALRRAGLDGAYIPLDIPPAHMTRANLRLLRALGFTGMNVTIPHKARVSDMCDEKSPSATSTGVVNTVKFNGDLILGENTDVFGFSKLIEHKIRITEGTSALVIGAGGAARAAVRVLADSGASVSVAARRVGQAEDAASDAAEALGFVDIVPGKRYDVVVNCTPVGMKGFPRTGLPMAAFGKGTVLFDLVYNPPVTSTMKRASEKGAKAYGGIEMLVHQGAEAFRIWTGAEPDMKSMARAARGALP